MYYVCIYYVYMYVCVYGTFHVLWISAACGHALNVCVCVRAYSMRCIYICNVCMSLLCTSVCVYFCFCVAPVYWCISYEAGVLGGPRREGGI